MSSIDQVTALLEEAAHGAVFRFRFLDADVYELVVHGISKDLEEEVPRCYATVSRVLVQRKEAARHFRPGKTMEFSLSDVQRVESPSDGSVLYEAAQE